MAWQAIHSRSAGFDIDNLLGKTCELEVIGYQKQDGSDRHSCRGCLQTRWWCEVIETENDQVAFDLDIYSKEFTGESCKESKLCVTSLKICRDG
jgi:hypothetical protein